MLPPPLQNFGRRLYRASQCDNINNQKCVLDDNITIREVKTSRGWCSRPRAGDRVSNSAAIPLPTAFYGDRFRCHRLDEIRLVPLIYNEFWRSLELLES
jgi:hypothetical protein